MPKRRSSPRRHTRTPNPPRPSASSASSALKPPAVVQTGSRAAGPGAAAQALQAKAEAALKKQFRGETLSNADISALARYEKLVDRDRRAEAYARCTPSDLAGLLAVGREQLRRWAGYGLPRNEDGSYNLGVFLPRLLDHERARVKAASVPAASALEQMRLVELEARRRRAAVDRGELGPAALYETEAEALAGQQRAEFQAWLNALPPALANKDTREIHLALRAEGRRLMERWGGLGAAAKKGSADA